MSTNYSPTIVTDGAVLVGDALMPSTATSATKLYNRAGNTNGTMYNGACCDFDGTDDDIHTTSDITLSGACAVSVWISSDTSTQHIFSNKSGGPVNLRFGMDSSKMTYQYYSAAWRYLYSTSTIPLTAWTHLVWVRTIDNYISFYINGVLDAGPTQALGSGGSASSSTVNGPVNIVGSYWSSAVFNGRMADFKVFNTALSSTQVKQMYDDSKVIIPDGSQISSLDLWYAMTEGVGSVAYDGSGNKNSGVGQNFDGGEFLSGQTGAPQLVEGYNRKLLFDGNDYVNCGSDTSLNFTTGNFSVSYWVYVHDITDVGYIVRRGTWGLDGWYTYLESSGRISIYTNDDGQGDPHTITISNSSVITENTWHHVVVVRNGATGIIYVDGTDETASGDSMIDPKSTGATCYIGSNTNYIKGIVDEVIVYDTVVTSSQAAALHATDANGGPLPPDPMSGASGLPSSSNVVSYWRNEGTATWTDRGNNSNDGSVVGTSSTLLFKQGINGSANTSTGRDNQGFPLRFKNVGAVGFNGSNTKVAFSDVDLNLSTGATVSFWCNHSDNTNGAVVGSDDNGYHSYIQPHENGTIYFESSDDSNTATGAMSFTDGFHNYVLVVKDYTATFYEDGRNITTDSSLSTANVSFNYIGTTGAKWFKGSVANLQMYNRALSQTEIKQNFAAQASRFT